MNYTGFDIIVFFAWIIVSYFLNNTFFAVKETNQLMKFIILPYNYTYNTCMAIAIAIHS